MSKLLTLLVVFSFSIHSSAEVVQETLQKSLAEPLTLEPLINEIVPIKAIPDHHFNLEAPQSCGPQGTISLSAREVSCQFHKSGQQKITVSVCDNAKKYCKQEYLQVSVRKKSSGIPRIKAEKSKSTKEMQSKVKNLLMKDFKAVSPDEARSLAKNKKAILIMVSTEWCPPCNVAKEFLLTTKTFHELTKDLLLIYVDGDGPLMDLWQPYLKSVYYPSFLILNQKMESIGLKTGYSYAFEFALWAQQSLKSLQDPITALKQRLDHRISKQWFQRVKDVFVSQEEIETDEKRWLSYLQQRNENEEAIQYMQNFSIKKYKNEIARTNYKSFWFGKKSVGLSEKESKEKLQELAKIIVKEPMRSHGKDDWLYKRITLGNCKKYGEKSSEMTDENCDKAFSKITATQAKRREMKWNDLTDAEKIIEESQKMMEMAEISKVRKQEKESSSFYDNCLKELDKLAEYTPLKTKSRAIRFKKLYCIDEKNGAKNEKIIQSLIKDYPYDGSFYLKLASYKLKQKSLKEALQVNADAVKYSYGDSWAKAIVQRAKILKTMNKKKQALLIIEKALDEIVLSKGNKRTWWLKSLRAEHRDLKEKILK